MVHRFRSFSPSSLQRSRSPGATPTQSQGDGTVHEGPEVDAVLEGLNAKGAAYGSDILVSSSLDDMARATVLAHEQTHVNQTKSAPGGGAPRLGTTTPREEREANIAADLRTPLAADATRADPNTVRLYDENQLLNGSVSPAWAQALSDAELESAVTAVRNQLSELQETSDIRTAAMANLTVLESEVMDRGMNESLDEPQPVALSLDDARPWVVNVSTPGATARDIAYELYGFDLSPVMPREVNPFIQAADDLAKFAGYDLGLNPEGNFTIVQDLLKSEYREEFHTKMEALLTRDLRDVKRILLYEFPDLDDINTVENLNHRWSRRGNLRARGGTSYYDAFLSELNDSYIVRDYLFFEANRRSFLDEMYALLGNPVSDRGGNLTRDIAQNSQQFGAFTPYWEIANPDGEAEAGPNKVLVQRTTNQILDRIDGMTFPEQSAAIVEMMDALPPGIQHAVIQQIMDAHDETIAWGLFGRFGEPTGDHMIYHLFENLEESDREELGRVLQASGAVNEDGANAFIEGRSWAGRNLPMTTYWASDAVSWYQKNYEEGGSSWNLVGAGFAGLWTPENASSTILTLTTARLGLPLISRAPQTVQTGLLALGTGYGAYNATTLLGEAATGETTDGRTLNEGERVTRLLQGFMEVASLAEMAHFAHQADNATTALARTGDDALDTTRSLIPEVLPAPHALPPVPHAGTDLALPGGTGGGGGVRMVHMNEDGTVLAVARSMSGEHAILSINMHTGNGSIIFPGRGVHPIEGFNFVAPRRALGPGTPDVPPGEPDFDAIARHIDDMSLDDLTTSGMLGDVFRYGPEARIPGHPRRGGVREARAGFNDIRASQHLDPLPGRPGRTPDGEALNPNPGAQGAHVTPQSAARGYLDPNDLVARMMVTGKGHQHTVFDAHWQATFRQIRQATGRTTTTAQEVFDVVSDAMCNSGAFSPAEAETMVQLLRSELFLTHGLSPNSPMRMPGS